MTKTVPWPLSLGRQDSEFKLDRTLRALNILGNPHKRLHNVIHIGGTNGKGSTLAFTESILIKAGYSVLSYISPSLVNLNERIRINTKDISDKTLAQHLEDVRQKISSVDPNLAEGLSFFEGFTVVAFYLFANTKHDFILLEVGLGGRFDATNVIENPLISIITQISFDHMEYLGDSIKKIAKEKAEIMKNHSAAIISKQNYIEVASIFEQKSKALTENTLYKYGEDFEVDIHSRIFSNSNGITLQIPQPSLSGVHQFYNAANAVQACHLLGIKSLSSVISAISTTVWQARMQFIKTLHLKSGSNIDVILDGGHNEGSVVILSDYLKENAKKYDKIYMIYGAIARKDLGLIVPKIVEIGHYFAKIFCTEIHSYEPSHTKEHIRDVFYQNNFTNIKMLSYYHECILDVKENHDKFLSANTKPENIMILIYGSLYLAGEVLGSNVDY